MIKEVKQIQATKCRKIVSTVIQQERTIPSLIFGFDVVKESGWCSIAHVDENQEDWHVWEQSIKVVECVYLVI